MTTVTRQAVPVSFSDAPVPGTALTVKRRSGAAHPFVPAVDPTYLYRKGIVEECLFGIQEAQNVLLVGDAGTGKSSLVEQLAALANQPLRRINLHGESDTTLLVGRDLPTEVDGVRTLKYVPGILATAMIEGYWLLLDELDAALQPMLFVLQGVLEDGGKLILEDATGTVIRKHPDFRLFATGNTIGIAGRNKLLYSGTMSRLNEATLDRFGLVVHVPPMDRKDELLVLQRAVPGVETMILEGIVNIAAEIRKQLKEEALTCTFSTRRCIQWARATKQFHPLRAARVAVLNKLSVEDAKVVEGVIQRAFGK
jgi:cobaltochelatase CobS